MTGTQLFEDKDGFLYLKAEYAEFYIPKDYLDNGWAKELAETIETFAVFNVGIFEKGALKEITLLKIPCTMQFYMYDKENRVLDFEGSPNTQCIVLKYVKGQKVMEDAIIEDSANVATYLDMILKGKLPSTIPYDKSLELWMSNLELNHVSFGVPSTTLEMILAVCYRYKDDISKKFASIAGKNPDISMHDYIMASIRKICQYGSTFTGMTFEDINSMITTSVNRTRDKKEEMESPIEKIIKY